MYLKYRSSSGVQTPVFNIAQIPTLTLAKLPTVPYSKQGIATLWNSSHLLSNGDVYTLSASAASYQWLDFEFMYEDGVFLAVHRVYSPNGKTVDFNLGTAIQGNACLWRARAVISGNKVTFSGVGGLYNGSTWPVKIYLRTIRGGGIAASVMPHAA